MNDLLNLMNLIEDINNIYLSLYKLECLGDRESNYFFDKINELKKLLIKEENLFNKLVTSSEYSSIRDVVMESKGPVFSRINDYISRYERNNEEDYIDEENKITSNIRKLYDSCSKNIYLVYLSYLQNYIDTTDNSLMKEKLLSLKYYDAFIRLEIGEILINNDFNVSKTNYVDLYLIADMLMLKEENISYEMIDDAHATVLKEMIRELFSVTDDKYQNYDIVVASKNIEFMISACLLLINDSYFEYIQDEMFLLIDELSNDNNTKAFDIIDRVLDSRNNDKSRVMKLSLRPIDWE